MRWPRGLAAHGADILAVGRDAGALAPVCRAVEALGRTAVPLAADVSDMAAVAELFAAVQARGRDPDIRVNNAGIEQVCPSAEVAPELWDRIVDTSLKGAFFVARGFARPLLAAGRPGSIVNLGSLTSAVGGADGGALYGLQGGDAGANAGAGGGMGGAGIRVNALGPGDFRTDLTEVFHCDEGWHQAMPGQIPMGRFGRLEDLVGAKFLSPDAACHGSGQSLRVDRGHPASIRSPYDMQ